MTQGKYLAVCPVTARGAGAGSVTAGAARSRAVGDGVCAAGANCGVAAVTTGAAGAVALPPLPPTAVPLAVPSGPPAAGGLGALDIGVSAVTAGGAGAASVTAVTAGGVTVGEALLPGLELTEAAATAVGAGAGGRTAVAAGGHGSVTDSYRPGLLRWYAGSGVVSGDPTR